MRKAFLSHNSADKLFVESVAQKLRREQIIFDKYIFEEAVDFRNSIQEGLDETDLFVLFASEKSLQAPWVNYEIDEAELRIINNEIKNFLIFIIGDILIEDLPKWCQKKKVLPVSSPSQTARIIQNNLYKVSEQKEVFIGREELMKSFNRHLFSSVSNAQTLVFVGLEGQGRRTFAKNVLEKFYRLEMGPSYEFNNDSSLTDLYVQLLYEELDNITTIQYSNYVKAFEEASIDEKISEIIRIFKTFTNYRAAPVIIDKGGLLNADGKYHDYIMKLIEEANKIPNLYLVLIQTRNPYGYTSPQPFFVTFIGEIEQSDMSLLLFSLLRNINQLPERRDIQEVSSYLDGYPPAALYATNLIEQKGMSLVIKDKRLLTEFKAGIFTGYLQSIISNNNEELIIKTLASIPSIPYLVLETIVDIEDTDLVYIMNKLIDNSVVYHKDNKYSLASPLRETTRFLWGYLNESDYKNIAHKLKGRFWNKEQLPDPVVIDILIVALLRAKLDDELEEFVDVILPSSILKAANSAYINNEWKLAKKLSLKVLKLDPDKDSAKVILAKSYIRLNEYDDANKVIKELGANGHKEYHPLQGYKFLKKRQYQEAISHYNQALSKGYKSKPIFRGIAECYYWRGDYDNADIFINHALNEGRKPNKFIVDLAAKIAIEKEDFNKAEKLIETLEIVDRPENVAHRKSVFLCKQDKWEEALPLSEKACTRTPPLPETFLIKAHIQIVLEKFDLADNTLQDIKKLFAGYENRDAYIGLQCKYFIAQDNWVLAEKYFERLQNKNAKHYKIFKMQILKLKMTDANISLFYRKEYEKEYTSLEEELKNEKDSELKFYEENK